MNKMATAFKCSVADLENELIPLILNGEIQARIDSQNKVSLLLRNEPFCYTPRAFVVSRVESRGLAPKFLRDNSRNKGEIILK